MYRSFSITPQTKVGYHKYFINSNSLLLTLYISSHIFLCFVSCRRVSVIIHENILYIAVFFTLTLWIAFGLSFGCFKTLYNIPYSLLCISLCLKSCKWFSVIIHKNVLYIDVFLDIMDSFLTVFWMFWTLLYNLFKFKSSYFPLRKISIISQKNIL